MKKVLSNGMVSSLILIVLGIFLMIWPGDVMTIACYIIGCGLIIAGAVGLLMIVLSKRKDPSQAIPAFSICKDIVSIVIGIVLIAKMETVVSVLPFIIGLIAVVNGAFNAVQALMQKKTKSKWIIAFIAGLLVVVMGLIMMLYPFEVAVSQIFLMGLVLAVNGVGNLISTFSTRKKDKNTD